MVAQEQVLNRGYSFVLPGDKDHAVHSHSSRNKLLLLALRKIEPKLLASDEFRQRLLQYVGGVSSYCGGKRDLESPNFGDGLKDQAAALA